MGGQEIAAKQSSAERERERERERESECQEWHQYTLQHLYEENVEESFTSYILRHTRIGHLRSLNARQGAEKQNDGQ